MSYSNPILYKKLSKLFRLRMIQPWHYRIENKIDIYPKSKRYFVIKTKEWGNYRKNPETILYRLLKIEKQTIKTSKLNGYIGWLKIRKSDENVYYSCVGLDEAENRKRRQIMRDSGEYKNLYSRMLKTVK